MRNYLFAVVIACAFALAANASRPSAASTDSAETSNPDEPIAGEIAVSNEQAASGKSPFEPYGVGSIEPDSDPTWKYASLNAAERAVVDRGRDASKWNGIHNAYRHVVSARAAQARARAAVIQLGVEALGEGVVP